MKIWKAALACGALGLGAVTGAHSAQAQSTQFPDVPANHWAYTAVQDLADKGYVKGYPDGRFLGKRDLTRYEFATVIDRIVQTVNDLNAKVMTTPTGTPVTQDDLNKIQVLVDGFKTQLDAIGSQVTGLQDEIDALRQDVLDAKAIGNKAQSTADAAYSSNSKSKFTISGYVQGRFVEASSGTKARYPQGGNSLSGAYNGNYGQGGVNNSFEVRRARLKVAGQITPNTKYGVQIDLSGAVSTNGLSGATGTNTQQQVTTREAYVTYTPGDGTVKYPSITAGEFANPFGYILPVSSSVYITPERPLAFSEGNNVGLWDSQDYDKGAELVYSPQQFRFVYALVNGAGRQSEDATRHIDSIYRASYLTLDKTIGVGVSYYDGFVSRARPTVNNTAFPGPDYTSPKKQLFGLDAQVNLKDGIFVNAEFVKGKYEKRSYFNETASLTALQTDQYIKNNQVQGYYVTGGYTFNPLGNHPFTLAANYDKFLRSHSGRIDSGDAFGSTGVTAKGDATYDDVNFGYGALYNLDKATRLRLWYDHPINVAHAPGTPQPQRIGLFTTELQVKF